MPRQHAGRFGNAVGVLGHGYRSNDLLDVLNRNPSEAQQCRAVFAVDGENGRFHTNARGPAVQNHIHGMPHMFGHVGCGGRADATERVGAGRRHGPAGQRNQPQGDGVVRNANGHRGQAGGDDIRDVFSFGQHQRQRPRPKIVPLGFSIGANFSRKGRFMATRCCGLLTIGEPMGRSLITTRQ
jgi:hypothetical protein